VHVLGETGSTNADVRAAAAAGARPAYVVVADHQKAGRGRMDRTWETPAGAALTFSVLLRPEGVPDARWGWLPLLAGVAVAEAVRKVTAVDVRLKWPNDVLAPDGRKLAGILVERVETPDGPAAVVGIGLNVSTDADELPVLTATSLALAGAPAEALDRPRLLGACLEALATRFLAWHAAGGGAAACGLAEAYGALCATLGAEVAVTLGGSVVAGRAVTVDDDGALRLVTPAGPAAVAAGDVTHLR
jgi:BirA family transcriptional regulator, biotin operon repressor / biotin---[acetyl-CoA-carboxylase] ligase